MTGGSQRKAEQAKFDETSLPKAIGALFEMNNYDVRYDVHVHGAQIDLVAQSKGDPFAHPIYLEATIEYVSTEKYGKDTTKFLLLTRKSPNSTLICVSSIGFTASVKERALESGITALSYDELFARFEKFSPYLTQIVSSIELNKLASSYEEPFFNDSKGVDAATKWLSYWRGYSPNEARWLIILGEYGTGKTSLTKILQLRWLQDYHTNPSMPIPIRIELRNFSRQFDATGLLHHFLDENGLGHVPVAFMTHLIRTGRVVLILDGYDEMAQFMNSRERRACLGALAELAKDGAKGILTSRPNYFSETEELNVFEALYRTIEQQKYYISEDDSKYIQQERGVDQLIERYLLGRYERTLQDLNPAQTKSLVLRSLDKNPVGQDIVLSILGRVFRDEASGRKQSLSGKPVIIAYLLEIVNDIQQTGVNATSDNLTEWQIYKLIIDRLMLRDLQRSTLHPEDRRRFLQKLAITLSSRGRVVANEETFMQAIEDQFSSELRRLPTEDRRTRRIELFEDLRSSATLTRSVGSKEDGWVFSHNSLREYLATERFIISLTDKVAVPIEVPVTAAMRAFVASIDPDAVNSVWHSLSELWPQRATNRSIGNYLTLLWDAGQRLPGGQDQLLRLLGASEAETVLLINNLALSEVDFSRSILRSRLIIKAASAMLTEVRFDGMDISNSDFDELVADTVSFKDCDLQNSSFRFAWLFETDMTGANVAGADFSGIDKTSDIFVRDVSQQPVHLLGEAAIGYLRYNGATTGDVADIHVYRHHPRFPIVKKICEKVSEQKNSQLRGLTQRGEARIDPPFARQLVERLKNIGWITIDKNELVSATSEGRALLQAVSAEHHLHEDLSAFLRSWS